MEPKLGKKSFSFVNAKKNDSSQSLSEKAPSSNNSSSLFSKISSPFSGKSSPASPVDNSTYNHYESKPGPLKEKQLFDEIAEVRVALDYFLNSNISEAEAILKPHYKDSLYYSLGYSFILYLKCVMTFQQDDIDTSLGVLKHTIGLASSLRRKEGGWFDTITTFIKGTSLDDVKQMTVVERHAELVYAEAYLLKALLSIIHDESVMSFLRESLNIRSSYSTYMTLEKFVEYRNKEHKGKEELDNHFTSGVGLGVGCFSLILSMLPASVIKVAEFIGFSSDRAHGLHVLEAVGGWDKCHSSKDVRPTTVVADTGLRRQMCDMVLVVYHVVLSKMVPLSNVDVPFAEVILDDLLKHYPRGVFFLYFNGKLMSSKRRLDEAIEQYQLAIDTQKDWKQLQHMCFWEMGIIYTMQRKYQKAYDVYTILCKESNWSKAVYTYLKAVNLYMLSNEIDDAAKKAEYLEKVVSYMEQVTGEKKRIAGKSIPMEKYVARKARKFLSQNNYLLLPDLEVLNAFTAYDFMPVDILENIMTRINAELSRLSNEKHDKAAEYYYDDLCLVEFLRSITARMLIEQGSNAEELHKVHEQSIKVVFDNADKIHLDHYIYYFSRYENARMLMWDKEYTAAEENVQVVLKSNDRGHYSVGAGPHAKNKYSLASALVFKCHNLQTQIKSELQK